MVVLADKFWDQSRRYDLLLMTVSEHYHDGVGVSEGIEVFQDEE